MIIKKDVVIVGGGPAGVITALTAKSVYPNKSVCVVKDVKDGVIPCAIPYMMYTLSDPEQNRAGNKPLEAAGIDIIVGKAVSIDLASASMELEFWNIILNINIWVDCKIIHESYNCL